MNFVSDLIAKIYAILFGGEIRSVDMAVQSSPGGHEISVAVNYKNGEQHFAQVSLPTEGDASAVARRAEKLVLSGVTVDVAVRQALAAAV